MDVVPSPLTQGSSASAGADTSAWALKYLTASSDRAVTRAVDYIHTRYREHVDVPALSRAAGLSKTVLHDRFIKLLGQSPMQYCTHWRLRMAEAMLRDGRSKSGEIAYAVGFGSEAAFNRAFKRVYGQPPIRWSRSTAAAHEFALPSQEVRYCRASDGTRLAWSAVGSGFPLVKTANWLNHLEFDWQSPVWRHWLRELTRQNRLIRYDERGNGLSDWNAADLSFESFVDDLERVVDAAGIDQFDLLGISQGAPVAIAFSLRHPGRIRRMTLLGGYARGWGSRLTGEDLARRQAMVILSRTGWGTDHPVFRQMFTNLFIPGGTQEQLGWWNDLQKNTTSPENAERLQISLSSIDVSEMLSDVQVPTLVAHALDDHVIPIEAGRELAAGIPGAKFVELESENHVLLEHEPAWDQFLRTFRSFSNQHSGTTRGSRVTPTSAFTV